MTRKLGVTSVVAILVVSCNGRSTVTRYIDDRHFDIPKQFAITAQLEWLPQGNNAGFLFVLNPNDQTRDQVIVLVQSNTRFCKRLASPSASIQALCSSAAKVAPDVSILKGGIKKLTDESGVWWKYVVGRDGERTTPFVIADCFKSNAPGNGGNCSSAGISDGLFYSFDYSDRQITQVLEFHLQIRKNLRSWEIHS